MEPIPPQDQAASERRRRLRYLERARTRDERVQLSADNPEMEQWLAVFAGAV